MSVRVNRIASTILVSSLVVVVTCIDSLHEDEFLCEEAHARLVECCPGFRTDSEYCASDSGCSDVVPALSSDESRCIKDSSCDRLRNEGICARAAAVTEHPFEAGADGEPPSRGVCR
jgi:hypothetical protein